MSGTSNNNNLLPIDYVTKDYRGFLEMMKEQIPSLTPEWTDTSDTDMGMVILQLLAYGLHILGYYEDKAVVENLLPIAKTKKGIILLSRFIGYEMRKQTPSVTTVRFYKDDTKIDEVVIVPERTQVSTDPQSGEQIIFETDEALIIDEGQEYGDVTVTQGESVDREFLGVGDGTAGQKFTLEYPDVIEDSLQIITQENGKDYYWERVDNFINSNPSDRHFMTSLDEEDRTVIIFGDGNLGMRPIAESNIYAYYRHGGGTIGNLAAGLINYLVDSTVLGISRVENIEPAVGGQDYEDIEHIREMAPKQYRSGGRAVTPQDFQDIAELVPGVSRALCEETFNENNDVNIYIATTDFTPAPQALLDLVKEELDKVRVMNNNVNVYNCLYKDFDVDLTVYIYDNFVAEDVKADVETLINGFLQPSNFSMGAEIYISSIINKAYFASGVKNVVVNQPTEDVVCAYNELPKLNSLNVTVVGGVQ